VSTFVSTLYRNSDRLVIRGVAPKKPTPVSSTGVLSAGRVLVKRLVLHGEMRLVANTSPKAATVGANPLNPLIPPCWSTNFEKNRGIKKGHLIRGAL